MSGAEERKNPGSGGPDHAFGELLSTEAADQRAERLGGASGAELFAEGFPVSKKFLGAMAGLIVLLAIPYASPSLMRFRTLSEGISFLPNDAAVETEAPAPVATVGEAALPGPTDDQQARGAELDVDPTVDKGPIAKGTPLPIPAGVKEDKPPAFVDNPAALARFFDKLIAVEQKQPGAIARVVYFGDSIVASDFITGKLRRLLQDRFGDSGHGYAIVANAFPGWFHIDVARRSSDQWKTSRCLGPFAEDGFYGLGCVSFTSRRAGEWFSMGTADRDKWGTRVSRFELEYLAQPGGGGVEFILDGVRHSELSTESADKALRYHTIDVEDGPHLLEVKTTSEAPTRLFGMRMERAAPGVTLSALGLTGARARFLDQQDDAHFREVLRAAKPDLVVLAFGTNEVGDGLLAFDENGQKSKDPMGDYERHLKALMAQIGAAVPESSLMLVGPPDMATKKAEDGHSKAMVATIISHQQACATELNWAYWNQYKAMGGAGSMWAWVQSGLGSADLIHPTGSGGNILGKLEYLALMHAYEAYKSERR